MNLEKIKSEALKVSPYEFEKLLDEFEKQNDYYFLKGSFMIIGDLHGDLDSLLKILEKRENEKIIFLGDYGDRGPYQVEVYYFLLRLKEYLRDDVVLLRGNHEYAEIQFSPHDLPRSLLSKFGNKAYEVYEKIKSFWNNLSYFTIVNEKIFLVHGGIPISSPKIDELTEKENIIQMLWNDPTEEKTMPSYRGIGHLFSKEVTKNFLEKNSLSLIIRSHEPCNAFKFNHDNKVLTIFSMKNVYGNEKVGFVKIDKKLEIFEIYNDILNRAWTCKY